MADTTEQKNTDAAQNEATEAPATDPAPKESEEEQVVEANATPAKTVRSLVLTGFGGLKMVKLQKRAEPSPGKTDVLIRVKACGLSFQDLMVRQGVVEKPHKTPVVMGFECSGEVEAVGEEVTGFTIGDYVIGFSEFGAWSELVSVPETSVYKMPSAMTFKEAAALPLSYLTAYMLLFEIGNLQPEQSVMVHSVGGGVGTAVSQLCKTVDNVNLYGTASSAKHETLKDTITQLFDHLVDYSHEVKKSASEGVDLVLDSLGGENVNKGIGLLKPMGKYVLYGSSNLVTGETKSFFSFAKSWWQVDKVSPIKLYDENRSVTGFNLRHLLFHQGKHAYVREIMDKLFQLYNNGAIKPTIDSTHAFEDVRDAMQRMHDRKNIGKVILDPTMEPTVKATKKQPKATNENTTEVAETKEENEVKTTE